MTDTTQDMLVRLVGLTAEKIHKLIQEYSTICTDQQQAAQYGMNTLINLIADYITDAVAPEGKDQEFILQEVFKALSDTVAYKKAQKQPQPSIN